MKNKIKKKKKKEKNKNKKKKNLINYLKKMKKIILAMKILNGQMQKIYREKKNIERKKKR